jgi:hypothetical protein
MDALAAAFLEEVPKFLGALTLLGLAWFVGQRLTVNWSLYQKRREQDLETARDFHLLYGEFFAVWKLWNYYHDAAEPKTFPDASRWALLDRACEAEGRFEAILVRLASNKELNDKDVEILGQFRQVYQTLRESIRDNIRLEWNHSTHPSYVLFKSHAPLINSIILNRRTGSARETSILKITSNQWESTAKL